MLKKLFLITLIGTPALLILLIIIGRITRGPSDAEMLAKYKIQIHNIGQQWDKFDTVSGTDESFSNQFTMLIEESASEFRLTDEQKLSLKGKMLDLYHAYSAGTYNAYTTFRFPSGTSFSWVTNELGNVNTALKKPSTIALPKAIQRWFNLKNKNKYTSDWAGKPADECFQAYVKLYAGEMLFSNYFTGISFHQSRIVLFSDTKNEQIQPAWKTAFAPTNIPLNQGSYAAAPTRFLNMGYMSQKRYTFVKYDDSLEATKAHFGAVTIADCFLFVKRQDADGNLPIIVRFYWNPKSMSWLPDDLVVCNMEHKGDFWPIF